MKKALSMLLAILLMVSAFAGCGQEAAEDKAADTTTEKPAATTESSSSETTEETSTGADEKIVLRIAWWGNPTRDERTQAVLDLYTELNPNVTFETEPIGWSGYWDKLATQTAGGSLPDIIQQDYAFIGQYIDRGVLADLTPYMESGALDLTDVSASILEGGSDNGGLFGVPLGMNALAYCYNTELMGAAGVDSIDPDWTWADFDSMVTDVYTTTGVRSDTPIWDDPKFMLEYLLRQNGMDFYAEDGKSLGFEMNNVVVSLFERLNNGVTSGEYPRPEEFANVKTMEESMFVTGKTLGGFIWSNFFVAYSDLMDPELELTVLPNDNDASGLYLKPSQFFSVTETSAHKEEAAKFIDFFTNSIEANNILLAERGIPVASAVREGIKGNVSADVAKTFDYIALAENYAKPISAPEPVGASEVTKLLKNYYEQVAYGMMTPEEAAGSFVEEANAILAAN